MFHGCISLHEHLFFSDDTWPKSLWVPGRLPTALNSRLARQKFRADRLTQGDTDEHLRMRRVPQRDLIAKPVQWARSGRMRSVYRRLPVDIVEYRALYDRESRRRSIFLLLRHDVRPIRFIFRAFIMLAFALFKRHD